MIDYKISKRVKIERKELWIDDKLEFVSSEDTTSKIFKSIYKHLEINYPKYHKMDLLCKLGLIASEALFAKIFFQEKFKNDEVAIVLSNSNSTINIDSEFYKTIENKKAYFPSPSQFVYTLPNIVIGEIAIKNNIKGEIAFLVQEKFNESILRSYISDIFNNNMAKACLAGWLDVDENNIYKADLFWVEK